VFSCLAISVGWLLYRSYIAWVAFCRSRSHAVQANSQSIAQSLRSFKPPGESFPQLVSFFRILGVARKNAAFECLGAIWCDMEQMVPDECMVLEKYPTGSLVYVLIPAPQFLGLACIIDIRGSSIGREVKVRFFKSRSNLELPDAWILERSRRLELFSRYHQDDEIDVVP